MIITILIYNKGNLTLGDDTHVSLCTYITPGKSGGRCQERELTIFP